jgi:hypothetical protein
VAVGQQVKAALQQVLDVVKVRIGGSELSLDGLDLARDPRLLLLQ